MLPTRSVVCARTFLVFGLLAASACGCTHGPYIAHATIQWPGASLRQLDESVAKPVGRHMFGSTNGVLEITSFSSAGKVDFYAKSDGLTKQAEFVQAISQSLADASEMLPRGVVASPIELLPKGEPIPQPAVHSEDELSIDIDRAKLIDTGLSSDDIFQAQAKARQDEAFRPPAGTTAAAAAARQIKVLNATTLPSREKPVTLGDVTSIHVVAVPDTIERHWP